MGRNQLRHRTRVGERTNENTKMEETSFATGLEWVKELMKIRKYETTKI
jgi:hypothetical protein